MSSPFRSCDRSTYHRPFYITNKLLPPYEFSIHLWQLVHLEIETVSSYETWRRNTNGDEDLMLRGLSRIIIFLLDLWTPRTGLIDCSETSVENYHFSLSNNPEERSSHLLRGRILKSPAVLRVNVCIKKYLQYGTNIQYQSIFSSSIIRPNFKRICKPPSHLFRPNCQELK